MAVFVYSVLIIFFKFLLVDRLGPTATLNNGEITKFCDFASDFVSWSQKSRSGKIGQNFNVFLLIKCHEIGINQIIN